MDNQLFILHVSQLRSEDRLPLLLIASLLALAPNEHSLIQNTAAFWATGVLWFLNRNL